MYNIEVNVYETFRSEIAYLTALFINQSHNFYVLPDFVKTFTKTVKKEVLMDGETVVKEIFPKPPKLLNTAYAFYWFNVMKFCYDNYHEDKEKILDLAKKLNYLYGFIHFNSLVKKLIPYNFDANLFQQAVQKSKAVYLKMGIPEANRIITESVTKKILENHYSKDWKLNLVRGFYEIRHRLAQITKPTVAIYYKLKQEQGLNKNTSGNDTNTLSDKFFVLLPEVIKNVKANKQNYSYLFSEKCNLYFEIFLDKLQNIDHYILEYIILTYLKTQNDLDYWITDDKLEEVFKSVYYNIEFNKETAECFLNTLVIVYKEFLKLR